MRLRSQAVVLSLATIPLLVAVTGLAPALPRALELEEPALARFGDPADAPGFRLTDTWGDKVRLSDYRGKIVALHFFAKWCASCVPDLRHFQDVYERYGARDVVVIGLAYASGDRESVGGFVESLEVTFPVLTANAEVLDAYNVATFPSNVIVDGEGKIRHVAQRLMDARYWEGVFRELLAEMGR